jgi:hypothetical protein
MGLLGFSDVCATTFEGSVVYMPLDWLAVGYEYRQNEYPYATVPNIAGGGDDWHVVCVGLVLKNMTLCAGWACMGNLANSNGNGGWALQFKYEF